MLKHILTLSAFLVLSSCSENYYSYELDSETGDTINRKNENGKQGRWVQELCANDLTTIPIHGPDSLNPGKIQLISNPPVLEEGNYVDDKKQGTWRYYHKDGSLHHTEEFIDGCSEACRVGLNQ